jgi:hypothetical protein
MTNNSPIANRTRSRSRVSQQLPPLQVPISQVANIRSNSYSPRAPRASRASRTSRTRNRTRRNFRRGRRQQ